MNYRLVFAGALVHVRIQKKTGRFTRRVAIAIAMAIPIFQDNKSWPREEMNALKFYYQKYNISHFSAIILLVAKITTK